MCLPFPCSSSGPPVHQGDVSGDFYGYAHVETNRGPGCDEIAHWLFQEGWEDPLPLREERHLQIELAKDASKTGWGGVICTPVKQETSDYRSRTK